jgi:hypothetical protein
MRRSGYQLLANLSEFGERTPASDTFGPQHLLRDAEAHAPAIDEYVDSSRTRRLLLFLTGYSQGADYYHQEPSQENPTFMEGIWYERVSGAHNPTAQIRLDTVANVRTHGETHRRSVLPPTSSSNRSVATGTGKGAS